MSTAGHTINRWWQLSACMIAMVVIANLQYTWTLFTVPLSTGLHAKLSDIQLAFTLFIMTQSWLVPVEGFLVDRLGARIVIAAGWPSRAWDIRSPILTLSRICRNRAPDFQISRGHMMWFHTFPSLSQNELRKVAGHRRAGGGQNGSAL